MCRHAGCTARLQRLEHSRDSYAYARAAGVGCRTFWFDCMWSSRTAAARPHRLEHAQAKPARFSTSNGALTAEMLLFCLSPCRSERRLSCCVRVAVHGCQRHGMAGFTRPYSLQRFETLKTWFQPHATRTNVASHLPPGGPRPRPRRPARPPRHAPARATPASAVAPPGCWRP